MKTLTETRAMLFKIMADKELILTTKEILVFEYHWYRYEMAFRKRRKAYRLIKKHARALDDSISVFALRKSMKNL